MGDFKLVIHWLRCIDDRYLVQTWLEDIPEVGSPNQLHQFINALGSKGIRTKQGVRITAGRRVI